MRILLNICNINKKIIVPKDTSSQIKTNKHTVFLMLGSNLGDRMENVQLAEKMISEGIGEVKKSSAFYETEPWGIINQPSFYNKLLLVETIYCALEVLKLSMKIEQLMGRHRTEENRWKERIMDIDIIYFDEQIIQLPELYLPHPRLHLRNFVLLPLMELAPNLIHPVLKKTTIEMLNECADSLKAQKVFIPQ